MSSVALSHPNVQKRPCPAERVLPDVLASVDLGSNSFHMVVARCSNGQLAITDRMRETVRLGSRMDGDGRLDRQAMARALACLKRFGQYLRDVRPDSVRVVGTNALRIARRKRAFLERASEALGHPIEIISGREEARLIYLGVAHLMPDEPGRQLVIDIGGGSTELIVGEGFAPLELESLQLGCVSLSERFFRDGRISARRLARARAFIRRELEPVKAAYKRLGWDRSVGSSGTVQAIGRAIADLDPHATSITPIGLERLAEYAIEAGHVRKVALASITDDRRTIFPGGLAIIMEIFRALGLDEMHIAEGAMREGLLFDMLGSAAHEDA